MGCEAARYVWGLWLLSPLLSMEHGQGVLVLVLSWQVRCQAVGAGEESLGLPAKLSPGDPDPPWLWSQQLLREKMSSPSLLGNVQVGEVRLHYLNLLCW